MTTFMLINLGDQTSDRCPSVHNILHQHLIGIVSVSWDGVNKRDAVRMRIDSTGL